MKIHKLLTGMAIAVLLLIGPSAAWGETARVVTPKGPLNMRREMDEKSKLVDSVPNKSLVEVVETGETWSRITYKKKTGYVKTEYLKIPANMTGKEVFPDEGTLLIRKEKSPDSEIVCPVNYGEAVTVDAVDGDWTRVHCSNGSGYVETKLLSYQYEEPQGAMEWMDQWAVIVQQCEIRRSQDTSSPVIAALEPGENVTVTLIEKEVCLLFTAEGCGYAPKSAVAILGETEMMAFQPGTDGVISRTEAVKNAEAALKKKYRSFSKERLYSVAAGKAENGETPDPQTYIYSCGFYNDQDQYLYGAIVDAHSGEVRFAGEYSGFAVLVQTPDLLPEGEVSLEVSSETAAVGEVLDIAVSAWTLHQTQYTLYKDGVQVAQSEPGTHFSAAYRPREAGNYRLTVTVTDEAGKQVTKECAFTVEGTRLPDLAEIYSQKDGWWKDKKYRHSNLGKSGCAIFALSHALYRMGHDEDAALPENLATKYAYCLIPEEGTSNELLINTAARDFGFKTQKNLITDKKQIAGLIQDGALFSFSIAKGHIAMVSGISEDGTMIRVVDSAPGATMERIKGASPYYEKTGGVFRAALTLDDLPGIRWYFETNEYGGLEYWLPIDYVAGRGVRLIQPVGE